MKRALVIVAALFCIAAAPDPAEMLKSPEQEARARVLFKEIRCVVCQNESIDDSQAELATDLRRVVRSQVEAGKSDQEVREFLVERYGEFILLRPRFSAGNAILWTAPFLIVLIGVGAVAARRRRAVVMETPLSDEERKRLEALVQNTDEP